ncbi:MAG: glycosyltransferase family 2 protein [Nitrosarchaeum sp.]
MSIIGRYSTLKMLFKLSKDAIRRYGFGYFISTVILEIRNNGFQIFAPQRETKISKYSQKDAYEIWLKNTKNTQEKIEQLKKEMNGFTLKPRMTVILCIKNETDIDHILESLRLQIYDNFHTVIDCKKELVGVMQTKTEKFRDMDFSFENFADSKKIVENSQDVIVSLTKSNILTDDAFFYVVKSLNKDPTIDIVYSDEDEIDEKQGRINPFFKPDWSHDLFLSQDYVTSFYTIKKQILKEIGGIRDDFKDAKHYDIILRATDKKRNIHHIAKVLSSIKKSDTSKDYQSFAKKSLEDTLYRRDIKGIILDGLVPGTFRIKYTLNGNPKVSIIIPTRDQKEILKRCIIGVEKCSYKNFEIIVIDNDSKEKNTIDYLNSLKYRVIKYQEPFNFSKMNNLAVQHAIGDYLLFLNDDTLPLKEDWLENMLEICQQKEIGVVGAKLVLSDNTIQHAGWVYLNTGAGLHPFQRVNSDSKSFNGQINVIRNYSAVTGACLLIKKNIFDEIGGFDDDYDLYYGDSDLCFKVIEKGYRVTYTPYALLLHEGSKSIKKHAKAFFSTENHSHFVEKWPHIKNGDPFYNPNLRLDYRINSDNEI